MTNVYLHVDVKDGGLGVPSLRATTPLDVKDGGLGVPSLRAMTPLKVKDGGLGVPSLRATTPFIKRDRLERLATSGDPMISHMVSQSGTFAKERDNCSRPPVRLSAPGEDLSGEDSMLLTGVTHVGGRRHWDTSSMCATGHGGIESKGTTRYLRSCSASWSAAAGQSCVLR